MEHTNKDELPYMTAVLDPLVALASDMWHGRNLDIPFSQYPDMRSLAGWMKWTRRWKLSYLLRRADSAEGFPPELLVTNGEVFAVSDVQVY